MLARRSGGSGSDSAACVDGGFRRLHMLLLIGTRKQSRALVDPSRAVLFGGFRSAFARDAYYYYDKPWARA